MVGPLNKNNFFAASLTCRVLGWSCGELSLMECCKFAKYFIHEKDKVKAVFFSFKCIKLSLANRYSVSIIILTIGNYNQVITINGVSKVILGQMDFRINIQFIKIR